MKRAVKNVADSMGVSAIDVMCLARSVINSLEKDKMVDTFKSSTNKDRTEIALAYVMEACKKWESFVSIYKTRDGAAEAFQRAVLSL